MEEAKKYFSVSAFMPGTIQKIYVKIGDKVKKGDKILILDAMKMDNELLSPRNGVVEKINITEGEKVPKNHNLVELCED